MLVALVFSSDTTASHLVAAVPAAGRAAREAALAGATSIVFVTPQLWHRPLSVKAEISRLAPNVGVSFTTEIPRDADIVLRGENITPAPKIVEIACGTCANDLSPLPLKEALKLLRRRQNEIFASSGKPGDGIISRLINRPVSKTITRLLLSLGPLHPMYATLGTALIGLGMLAVLIGYPGYEGQVWGALLFHTASMFDGVDGEISRTTFRASKLGATVDSLVDLATNIGFFAGLVWNLYNSNSAFVAAVALVGLVALASGKVLLGLSATRKHEPVTFNAVKDQFAHNPSRLKTVLTWLTMRDFYAFAAVIFLAVGLSRPAVFLFTIITLGWLAVVMVTVRREVLGASHKRTAETKSSSPELIRHT